MPPAPPADEPAGDAPWTPLEEIARELARRGRIAVTSHVNADGDAIGSSLGLARALEALGKDVRIVLADLAGKYRFLDEAGVIEVPARPPPADLLRDREVAVVLDASEPDRLGPLEKAVFDAPLERICIDHHLSGRSPRYALHFVDSGAASTASILLRLIDLLRVEIDAAIATPLFVALATDTGWFRFSNAVEEAYRDATRLVAAGARPEVLYTRVYESTSLPRLRLQGVVLERVRSELGGAFLWSALDRAAIEASGVPRADFEGLIDPLRTVAEVEIAALLTESDPGEWKISLRSRGEANVERVARRLGGGGHAKAAGCTVNGTLAEVSGALREEVRRELEAAAVRSG